MKQRVRAPPERGARPPARRAGAIRGCMCCSTGATGFLGQGDPGPGRGRPPHRGARGGGAPGDGPRPQDEGGVESAVAGAAGARAPEASPHRAARGARSSASWTATSRSRTSGSLPASWRELRPTLTHVIHCAASVSFDDPYETSFRANVLGCRNALDFSSRVQRGPGLEVHRPRGHRDLLHPRPERSARSPRRSALVFPRALLQQLLRAHQGHGLDRDRPRPRRRRPSVTQLLPSIVIGHSRTGNNRGDTKVVNAPINAFGRAKEAMAALGGDWSARARALARSP